MVCAVLCAACCWCAPLFAGERADPSVQATIRAAKMGDPAAQLRLGDMYDLGQGVAQDQREAVRWYALSARQGNAQAQFALAEMYKNGDGVNRDLQEALKWYRKAADQGHPGAQLLLGVIYESGTGVTPDLREAARWYRLAANGGDARAQLLLGNFYNTGQGVARNAVAAYALYTVSAGRVAQNNPALTHRANLAKGMSTAEVDRATALAREMDAPGKLLEALDRHLAKPAR
ncbi:tetratricopeptide repeat protein [Accumulibacter sp.]|uniref:tetratricopeptide repeat protein n=2 Tax=Accumulibacter sp. TaxID=2053492 RepID=UPI0025FE1131|nr:tetratricopeptide repeat protein [Accumulibacter sp.]MCM8624499.1 sel1 repeat family protein [Accumulibacter sp.]